jgi:hypothetical protein
VKCAVLLFALLVACDKGSKDAPTAWDKGGDSGPASAGSVALANAVEGTTFWPFFPDKGMDDTTAKIVETTKIGMAEVAYKKGKDEVVTLIISDTFAMPAVRDDYKAATDKVSGYPLKTSGTAKSAILVADRFEVTCASPRLDGAGRRRWLEKVDLPGLAKVK